MVILHQNHGYSTLCTITMILKIDCKIERLETCTILMTSKYIKISLTSNFQFQCTILWTVLYVDTGVRRELFRIDFGTRWNYLRTWNRVLGNRRSMNCENKIKLWDTVWIISSVCILEKFEIVQRSFFSKIFLFSISGMKTKRLYSEICRSLQFSCIGGSTSQCYTWFRVDTQ